MRTLKMVSLIISLLLLFSLSPLSAADFAHTIDVKKVQFQWSVDGENLRIGLSGQTDGWVAIGFNPTQKMKDANIIIGYVKQGKVYISDDFGTAQKKHSADSRLGGKENVSAVSGSEKGGVTSLQFTIPLDSKDIKDTVIDPKKSTVVMLATGRRDSFRLSHNFIAVLDVNLETGTYQQR
ncbi:DOMON domain-containing protein [bacterium]|nr:DOMON domain-containing protein [bacterium]